MNQRVQDALIIGIMTAVFSSASSWISPRNWKATIVGGAAGAMGAAVLVQQNRRLSRLEQRTSRVDSGLRESLVQIQQKLAQAEKQLAQRNGQLNINQIELKGELYRLRDQIDQLQSHLTPKKLVATADQTEARSFLEPEPESEDIPEMEEVQEAIDWFRSRKIEIENYYQPDPQIDELLDDLAVYLGENYLVLKEFYQRLKNSIGKRIPFKLQDKTQRDIAVHCEFLKRLKAASTLSYGQYLKTDRLIIATPHSHKDIDFFLRGGWFERFVYNKIAEYLDFKTLNYQCLRNPTITYTNGDRFELDLFFLVKGQPLLIECKSGQNYDEGLEGFAKHRERLSFEPNHAIFVVLDIAENQLPIRSKQWQITVANATNFVQKVNQALQTVVVQEDAVSLTAATAYHSDLDSDTLEVITPGLADSVAENTVETTPLLVASSQLFQGTLADFLKKQKLNLAPEHRQEVIRELVNCFAQLDHSITFTQLITRLVEKLRETSPISRNKLTETLHAVRLSQCFLNKQGRPVRHMFEPISSLVSADRNVIEAKCLQYYRRKIQQLFDPNFFEDEQNVQEFDRLMNRKVPLIHDISESLPQSL